MAQFIEEDTEGLVFPWASNPTPIMPGASQQHYYPDDYVQTNGFHHEATNGHFHHVGNEIAQQNSQSELQHCHQTITNLEGRIVLLEKMCRDYESRLQVQEDARIASDFEKKKAREGYEQRIQHYERRISDMTLHIRTRDTQFLKAQEKNRRLQKDFQTMQLKKHEMIQQAKREEREAIRREIDRERASLDTKQQPSGAIASNSISGSHTNGATAAGAGVGMRGDIRRQPSSGSMFTKAFAGQAPVGSGSKGSELKRTDQLRAACMEGSLNDFFQLPP